MHESTRSRISSLLVLIHIGIGCAFIGTADDFINDAAIKRSFEGQLQSLFEKGGVPKATTSLEQLRKEKRAAVVLPNPPSTPENHRAVFSNAKSATLILGHLYLCGKCDKYHSNLAGGVLLSPDGLALTNYHVLDFKEAIVFGAMTLDGKVFVIDEVIASSKLNDLALIQLRDAAGLPFASPATDVSGGDEIFVISHPDGYFYSLTKGIISRKYLAPKGEIPLLQITADFARGSSGAGIFNARGELTGLATSTSSIYYDHDGEKKDNLQMVIHSGIPMDSFRELLLPPDESPSPQSGKILDAAP